MKNLHQLLSEYSFKLGHLYNFDAIVTNVSDKLTKTDQRYLTFDLSSDLSTIEGRKWNIDDRDSAIFKQGHLLHLSGKFSQYQNKIQFIVEHGVVINDQERYQAVLPTAPNYQELKTELKHFFAQIDDPDYKNIIGYVFDEQTFNKFCQSRAALKNHHNVYGGLLWHTVTMLRLATNVLKTYDYFPINRSLLYSGIIFHDFGKILEIGDYSQNKYSLEGELIGHIVIGAQTVNKVGTKLNIDRTKVALLEHLILASHGKLENASPVEPKTIESVILSHLDNLDAKVGALFIQKNKGVENSNATQEVRLDGKLLNFYFHHLKK